MATFTDEETKIWNLSNLLKITSYSAEADESFDEDDNNPDSLRVNHMLIVCLKLSLLWFI